MLWNWFKHGLHCTAICNRAIQSRKHICSVSWQEQWFWTGRQFLLFVFHDIGMNFKSNKKTARLKYAACKVNTEDLSNNPDFFRNWIVFPCKQILLYMFISTVTPEPVQQSSDKMQGWWSRGHLFESGSVHFVRFWHFFFSFFFSFFFFFPWKFDERLKIKGINMETIFLLCWFWNDSFFATKYIFGAFRRDCGMNYNAHYALEDCRALASLTDWPSSWFSSHYHL